MKAWDDSACDMGPSPAYQKSHQETEGKILVF